MIVYASIGRSVTGHGWRLGFFFFLFGSGKLDFLGVYRGLKDLRQA